MHVSAACYSNGTCIQLCLLFSSSIVSSRAIRLRSRSVCEVTHVNIAGRLELTIRCCRTSRRRSDILFGSLLLSSASLSVSVMPRAYAKKYPLSAMSPGTSNSKPAHSEAAARRSIVSACTSWKFSYAASRSARSADILSEQVTNSSVKGE